ncbi:MAG: hypothetical protein HZA17_08570 [Nitrospirae bacterium]|nr:hypothetical protein [Nitrospirota bacterium]
MKDLIKQLMQLQDIDSRILEKRLFIDKVPLRIFEVDEPLKQARAELEKITQKTEALGKKKKDKERLLEEINEKIKKMKSRISDIKTNKEYQAHLKEIESSEREIGGIEEEILLIMEDLDAVVREHKEKERIVRSEGDKIDAFKKKLDLEVSAYEKELSVLKEERVSLASLITPDIYRTYMTLLGSGNGVAVTKAKGEICLGCNMNMPPQLFVEVRKNEEIIQCPQCQRILYYEEEQ